VERVTPLQLLASRWPSPARRFQPRRSSIARSCQSRSPQRPIYSELDARKAKPRARFEVKAPTGAPNVVIVLIDDIGFGGPSTFGGPIRTPTMDQLAQSGLRFNNFHTTARCSPTRNALKTGRNHHTTDTGSLMESSTAIPGNTGQVPNSLRSNGDGAKRQLAVGPASLAGLSRVCPSATAAPEGGAARPGSNGVRTSDRRGGGRQTG
jgi:hypothetical protein